MSLIHESAVDLLAKLQSREISARELARLSLDAIEARNSKIGAFLDVGADQALKQADEIDRRRVKGDKLGLLAGLPIGVKDVLCTKGWKTTCASRMLASFVPPYDATAIEKLRAADAIVIGKTNMDEFAMGGSTENSAFQSTRNPWDTDRTPGGSSGGSAAAVAARQVPLSIGTDTGGSIRQPAAFCGITGLKPTYGRVSRYGLVAFASSLDQVGPMGRSAADVAVLLEAISGHDGRDSTSADRPVPAFSRAVNQPLDGLRIGLVREHFTSALDSQVASSIREAVKVFEQAGAKLVDISLPHSKYAVATYYIIAPCEASSNLARYDGVHYGHRADEKKFLGDLEQERTHLVRSSKTQLAEDIDSPLIRMFRQSRAEAFGVEVKRRIMLGTYALSAGYYDAYYLKALKVRRLIRQDYDEAFRSVDIILGPTTPRCAFKIGELSDDPLQMYLEDLYTVSANLSGIPAISLPCGFSSQGLPIGLQLQAPAFEEERLLRAAHMFQSASDWHHRAPALT